MFKYPVLLGPLSLQGHGSLVETGRDSLPVGTKSGMLGGGTYGITLHQKNCILVLQWVQMRIAWEWHKR